MFHIVSSTWEFKSVSLLTKQIHVVPSFGNGQFIPSIHGGLTDGASGIFFFLTNALTPSLATLTGPGRRRLPTRSSTALMGGSLAVTSWEWDDLCGIDEVEIHIELYFLLKMGYGASCISFQS